MPISTYLPMVAHATENIDRAHVWLTGQGGLSRAHNT
jgi:hypothetical protein